MPLTRDEVLVAARRAREYPRKHGYSYFVGRQIKTVRMAAEVLAKSPALAEHG
jgi:hypothetical protein